MRQVEELPDLQYLKSQNIDECISYLTSYRKHFASRCVRVGVVAILFLIGGLLALSFEQIISAVILLIVAAYLWQESARHELMGNIVGALFPVVLLTNRHTGDLTAIRSDDELSLRTLHYKHDALVQAIARIDDPKEFPYLKTHYDLIFQLLRLRDRGTPEEEIIKSHMDFRPIDGFGGSQGWRVPIYDNEKSMWTLWRFSPYYIATRDGVRLHKLQELLDQAREHVRPGGASHTLAALGAMTHQFDNKQFPDAEEHDVAVYYKHSDGSDREWPEPAEKGS